MLARIRRTELQQNREGDWYVDLHDGETIVGIDFSPSTPPGGWSTTGAGGGGGGASYFPRRPVVWIMTGEELEPARVGSQ